jgi:hypothetical protein
MAGLRTFGRAISSRSLSTGSRFPGLSASPVRWQRSFPITAAGQFRNWDNARTGFPIKPARKTRAPLTHGTLLGKLHVRQ